MSKNRTLLTTPGYGQRLRERLETAGLTQQELAHAASISRQTIHRAITRDELSQKTADRIDSVLAGRTRERGTRASRAWADATDLAEWSKRRDAQEDLPRLVRRLIQVTVDDVRRMSFRSGEGVQLGGWDGRVLADTGNAFVPQGESVWEMGTTSDIASKASDDYSKRTASPGDVDPATTTFVFVTSRRFSKKDEWSAARRADGPWLDVRVIDADDLEAWLESAPSVHVWLSARIGVFPESGAQDLESWFDNWSRATHPPLTSEFLLAGRKQAGERIATRISVTSVEPLEIQSESRSESVAVFAATLDDAAKARAVVVTEEGAWRRLIATRMPLILIALFDAGDEVMAGVRGGHAVVVPLGEGDVERPQAILLPPVNVDAASGALRKEMQVGQNETPGPRTREGPEDLARLARRSMTTLRRRIGLSPALRMPGWASPAVARTILPALFAGSWSDSIAGDRDFVERLAMKPYQQVLDDLEKWAHGSDPAVRHRGTGWYLVSREDAWELLAKYVRRDDWDRFYDAALTVVSTPDPRYELPKEQQWMAGVVGKKPPFSHSLRTGIVDFLALISTDFSARLVRELLRRANADWTIWASLSSELSDLAEAAPDEFLDALDDGLQNPQAPIAQLFTDTKNSGSVMFASSPHTGLLWALERLAWSPSHLGHTTEILAALARLDPGGQLTNRPSASLAAIFRILLPQTTATLAQRFYILDQLGEHDAHSAWEVLRSSLPRFHGSFMLSVRPKWRDWADEYDPERRISRAEYNEALSGTIDRLIKLAAHDGVRWASLIEALPQLESFQYDKILASLRSLNPTALAVADRSEIWAALRNAVGQFRAFPDARWAASPQAVTELDDQVARFAPTDLGTRFGWLFGFRANLPDATVPRTDFDGYRQQVHARRIAAVRQVFEEGGLSLLFELASKADRADFVGDAAGELALLSASAENDLLRSELSGEVHRDHFTRGYARSRQKVDSSWVLSKVESVGRQLRADQLAALLNELPSNQQTWAIVAEKGLDVERKYWENQQFLSREEDLEPAVEKLLQFDQVSTAVYFMGAYASSRKLIVRPELALEALERLAKGDGQVRPVSSDLGWDLAELLAQLADDASVDRQRLARLEWLFLPVLESRDRSPKALQTALEENPSFFVELVSAAFRGDNDPKDDGKQLSDEDRQLASRAYQLLHSWRTIPPKLKEWVSDARRLLREARRVEIGDEMIGQILSGSPSDPDGTWPPQVVRDVIEDIHSEALERGIAVGKYNLRGVTTRSIGEGGRQERAIADRYEGLATAVESTANRTARMLRKMAKSYLAEADHEDLTASIEADIGS